MGLIHVPNQELYNPPGIIGWWKFDEASSGNCNIANSVLDYSGLNNNCTPTNNPTYQVGIIGKGAIKFPTTGYLSTANVLPVNGKTLSVSFWINSDSVGSTYTNEFIMELSQNANSYNGSFFIGYNVSSGGCYTYGTIQATQKSTGWGVVSNKNRIDDGVSHHIVVTLDRSQVSFYNQYGIYLDGVIQTLYNNGTNNTIMSNNFTNYVLYIGNRYNSSLGLNRILDDIKIYNRILSQSEITKLYTST